MLKAKDFRVRAWNALHGNWGTMALTTLIYLLITGAAAGLSVIGIGAVAELIITGPLLIGFTIMTMNVTRGNAVKIETLFDGFKNFLSAFLLWLINTIFIALWSLLFIIPGIIKLLSYSMSYYILADNPNMSAGEARKQSMVMMNGNKWRLFCLDFSFIGWYLLSILTLGILLFWVIPYQHTAVAQFYQSLITPPEAPEEIHDVPEIPELTDSETL